MESLIIFTIAFVVLSLQMLLCLKVRNIFFKLIPTVVTTGISIYFVFMMKTATSWDALGYALLWILSLIALAAIAVAWIVSMIIKSIIRHKRRK